MILPWKSGVPQLSPLQATCLSSMEVWNWETASTSSPTVIASERWGWLRLNIRLQKMERTSESKAKEIHGNSKKILLETKLPPQAWTFSKSLDDLALHHTRRLSLLAWMGNTNCLCLSNVLAGCCTQTFMPSLLAIRLPGRRYEKGMEGI